MPKNVHKTKSACLGGLERDAVPCDLARRVLPDPGLAERVFDPADLKPAMVRPQPNVL